MDKYKTEIPVLGLQIGIGFWKKMTQERTIDNTDRTLIFEILTSFKKILHIFKHIRNKAGMPPN